MASAREHVRVKKSLRDPAPSSVDPPSPETAPRDPNTLLAFSRRSLQVVAARWTFPRLDRNHHLNNIFSTHHSLTYLSIV